MANENPLPDVVSAQGLAGCVDGDCGKPIVGRGRCRKHYMRWWRRTQNAVREPALNLKAFTPDERFASKVQLGGPAECWPWMASRHRFGHGEFFVSRERGKVSAHAYALELATGEACPPDLEACHRCDNPPCCNPAHIYYGTRQQNVDDMWRRGRARCGETHPTSRINDAQALDIRKRFAAGESQTRLAEDFHLSSAAISAIVNGKNWKHVGGPIRTHGRPGRRPSRKDTAA